MKVVNKGKENIFKIKIMQLFREEYTFSPKTDFLINCQ